MEHSPFSVSDIRAQFPALRQKVYGKQLIYFDNGATSQKPQVVLDTLAQYYALENANIHRGVHYLSQQATSAYEAARRTIQKYIGANAPEEIIFTKGTTDSINLVAFSFGERLKPGDEILISAMEHHSNIVPWQLLCERKGCVLRVIPISKKGELDLVAFDELLSERTKLLALTHISNTLGTINPVKELIEKAHKVGAKVLLDGAQSIQHLSIDVKDLNCDFYTFSGHKVFGPTGIGVLYGKEALLDEMPPYQGGGEMIKEVTFAKTTYNDIPFKFEAGTPNIADVIAFQKALDFISCFGKANIKKHEDELLDHANIAFGQIKGFVPVGTAAEKVSVLSFNIMGMHPFDVGQMLDAKGIAVRTGHHCTQPLMKRFGIEGTVRASFAVYNTKSEIEKLAEGVAQIARLKNK